ncbi:MAG: FAD-dependent monooxygenase [Dehalococcoidia bacterium]|nr:FAD-dependent monooxygenase [Dehalococcoidia bacterium]
MYDLIVIGAGMAGLLAARAAAENGLNVAVIERKENPSKLDRACGQTIPSMNEYMFNNICYYNPRDRKVCFSTDGFFFRYDGPHQNLYNLIIFTPNGHRVVFGDYQQRKAMGDFGRVGMALDKGHMIQNLLDDATALSEKVFTGSPVTNVTPLKEGVVVEAGGKTFKARYLIAADGVNSRVASITGFNRERHFYCCYYALSYYLEGLKFPEHDQMVKLVAYLPEGYVYSYIVPRPYENQFNMLTLSVDPRVNLEKGAEYFMRSSFSTPWFEGARKLATMSAICNCYTPIQNPYRDNVIIAGDAGSTQEMENTGAMISGWKAGNAVATALLESKVGCENGGNTAVSGLVATLLHRSLQP